jgi:hypothetical protein
VAGVQQLTQLLQLPVNRQMGVLTRVLEGQHTAGLCEHMAGPLLQVQLIRCGCSFLEAFREAAQQLLLGHTKRGCHLHNKQR